MSIVREKLVTEDIELGYGIAQITDPTDPTGAKLSGHKVGIHTIFGKVYNVQDFGALGDGVTDDTAAIQLAITTAGADSVVFFPVGDYLISDPIMVTNSNMVLRGLGTRWARGNGALIQSNDANSDLLQITGLDNILVENLSLRHKVAAAAGNYVIDVQGGSQIIIQDCTIVSAAATTNCRDAINFQATSSMGITNCRVSGCRIGLTSNEGIWVRGYDATYKVENLSIDNCLIKGSAARGILVGDYVTNVSIDDNRILDCAGSIRMQATQDNLTDHICIRNNSLENATSLAHIAGARIENVVIQGNRLHTTAAGQWGISVATYCQYWSIIGNHIIASGEGGIFWDAENGFISNNYIDWGSGKGIYLGSSSVFSFVTGNLVHSSGTKYTDGGSGNIFGINYNPTALLVRARGTDPGATALENGDVTFWLNEAGNALTFRVKYAAGTSKTGTVALT